MAETFGNLGKTWAAYLSRVEGTGHEASAYVAGQRLGRGAAMNSVIGRGVWTPVCKLADLEVERGVAALVNGHAVALFRMSDDKVYALGNHDPFDRASVLARGIVGSRDDVPFVGSLMHKQAFDLRTGLCLDDPSVHVPSYQVKVLDGVIRVGPRNPA